MKPRLTVIDDDAEFIALVREEMCSRGWEVESALDPRRGFRRVLASPPDIILLDFDMPGESGLDFLVRLRSRSRIRRVPVILATAHHELEIRVQGFEAGLDDCLFKPFSFRELVARIDSVLRRAGPKDVRADFLSGLPGDGAFTAFLADSRCRSLWILEARGGLESVDRGSYPEGGQRIRNALELTARRILDRMRFFVPRAEALWQENGRVCIFQKGDLPAGFIAGQERLIRSARRYAAQKRPDRFLGPDLEGRLESRVFPELRCVVFHLTAGTTGAWIESAMDLEAGQGLLTEIWS